MKVGINLVNFGPAARPEVLARWAELAERLGYHSLLTSDHLAVTPDVQERYPGPFYEPLTILGWLAALTDRVELGTTVTIVNPEPATGRLLALGLVALGIARRR